jgi:acyl-CoA synthetase (AMP-forming)/AMP-acid ligase II
MSSTAPVNIAAPLADMAAARPHTLAIVQPYAVDAAGRVRYRHFTYRELNEETDRLAAGLERVGVRRGVRTVLMVPPSLEFYALTFALFKVGAIVVLIDPGMGVRGLGACLNESEPEAFIGVPKAHVARVLFGWARRSLRVCVTVGPKFGWGGPTLDAVRRAGGPSGPFALAATQAAETAAILFTSGSTGVAKGAVYSHGIFAAQVEMLRRVYGIEPGEVDLPTFPLFGLFGPALGMTAVIPQMDPTRPGSVDPVRILDAIRYFGVTNLFGSPALIRRAGAYGFERGVKLPTLRRVISAGAPVPALAIERFATMLSPGVLLHTPYGATEALPVTTIGSDELLGETRFKTVEGAGVCVGRPMDGMRVRIIRISDEPIPVWSDDIALLPGAVGEIAVQGPVVTRAYYNRPESTVSAKIGDANGGLWHRMGDLGYCDEVGRIWFCGRKSQRVVTREQTYFTVACEGVFNAHPAVARTALVGVAREGDVRPVLCVERDPRARIADDDLRGELLALGAARPHTRAISTILFHKSFPVDTRHNAKIFREKLAVWAAGQLR